MRNHDKTGRALSSGVRALAAAMSLAGLLTGLGGCTEVGPDFERPDARINDDWSKQPDPSVTTHAAANAKWWSSFGDPTLDHLIQLAREQNLPLQIAGLRIMEARAQLAIATGLQYPQLQELNAGASGVGVSQNQPNTSQLDHRYWDYQLGFDAAWELDFWGKYARGIESETANLYASVADYDDALVSLTAEVARTYAVIRTFEVLIDLAHTNADLQQEGLRIASSRFHNGATSELDVTQATTLLQGTLASIPKLQASLQQSRNALATLLGQTTGTVEALLEGPKGIPTPPGEVAVGMPAEMLRRRPDIRSAELYAAAQCARIGIAKADLYPSLSLVGSIGLETGVGGGPHVGNSSVHDLFNADSVFYAYGPRITWPFFNYGRIENAVRVQDARFQELIVNYKNTVLRAAQEVEDGLAGFVNARQATELEQKAVDAAQRSVDISFLQYREGSVDFQRVLDAQRALLDRQNTLAETRSSVATNLIATYKALGGGWEVGEDQPVVPQAMQDEMQQRTDWGTYFSQAPATEREPSNPPQQKR